MDRRGIAPTLGAGDINSLDDAGQQCAPIADRCVLPCFAQGFPIEQYREVVFRAERFQLGGQRLYAGSLTGAQFLVPFLSQPAMKVVVILKALYAFLGRFQSLRDLDPLRLTLRVIERQLTALSGCAYGVAWFNAWCVL